MTLQEALFLSSQKKAVYKQSIPPQARGDPFRYYLVQVEIKQEECTPLIRLAEGPFYCDVYEITVSRMSGDIVCEPHSIMPTYSLDKCIGVLHEWQVGEEYLNPWRPVEVWEEEEGTRD